MGDPKKQHKHYDSVKRPWDKDRITAESKLVKQFGIRRKKELRKSETVLRNLRQRARTLIGTKNEMEETVLLKKIYEMGLAGKDATVDSILNLQVETMLERRLQTILIKKELANTPLQARQFITHGHIQIDGIKVISPSYIVKVHEENKIEFIPKSKLVKTFKYSEKKEEPKKIQRDRAPRRDSRKRPANIKGAEE